MICTAGGETGNNRSKQKLAKVSKCFGLRYSCNSSLRSPRGSLPILRAQTTDGSLLITSTYRGVKPGVQGLVFQRLRWPPLFSVQ